MEVLQVDSVARTRHSLHLRDPPVEQRAFSLQRRSSADPERVDHTAVFSRALRVIQVASVLSAVPCGRPLAGGQRCPHAAFAAPKRSSHRTAFLTRSKSFLAGILSFLNPEKTEQPERRGGTDEDGSGNRRGLPYRPQPPRRATHTHAARARASSPVASAPRGVAQAPAPTGGPRARG